MSSEFDEEFQPYWHAFEPSEDDSARCGYVSADDDMCGHSREVHALAAIEAERDVAIQRADNAVMMFNEWVTRYNGLQAIYESLRQATVEIRRVFGRCDIDDPLYAGLRDAIDIIDDAQASRVNTT